MVNPVEFWPASNVDIERLKHNARVDRQKIAVVVVEGILKVDTEYCHGLHVTEDLSSGKSSPSSNSSIATGGSSASAHSRKAPSSSLTTSYRIWRTWEECLIFQSILERRYKDLAKAKRASLRKETSSLKTVKSHTRSESSIYSSSTSASSFASLPTGADLRMIAKDVHHIVPKLTIKQSLFSTSPAGVAKQNDQLILFIKSLWGEDLVEEDLPMLFSQLKEDDEVRDFFSFRYSDRDITVKHGLQFNPELKGTLALRRSVSSFTDSDRHSIASFATNSSSSSDSSIRTRRRSMINMLRRPPESLTIKSLENMEQQQVDRVSIYDPESRDEIHDWRYVTHAIAEDLYEEEGELQVKDMTENSMDSRFSKPLPAIDEYCLPTFSPYGAQEDSTVVSDTVSTLSNSYVPGDLVLEYPQLINAFSTSNENDDYVMSTCPLATSTYGTIPESNEFSRPPIAEVEEYGFGADTPTHLSFVSSMAKSQHSRQISSTSTIMESRESDDDADSLMDAFAFASINSPIKAPNSRPSSVVSYTSTGSIRDLGCLPDPQ